MRELELGLSPCPNDTFMFWAWVHGAIDGPPVRPWLADIEELNRRACGSERLPITKISAALVPEVRDAYRVSRAGAALGRGCGPLVVVRDDGPRTLGELRGLRVAHPGASTTARALLRAFGPDDFDPVELRFDRIAPAVARGDCDAGVIIHETRFTYDQHGLRALADLGEVWEDETGLPIPLGVIAVRRDVGDPARVTAVIRASVEHAFARPDAPAAWVREHAQELDDEVCARHITLYVNQYSIDVGSDGRRAVDELVARCGGSPVDWV